MNSRNNTPPPSKVNNIFADIAPKYSENGYRAIPIRPLTKIPAISQWQEWCSAKPLDYLFDSWCNNYAAGNIGIALGSSSNIIAIDFDNDVDGLREKIESLLCGSPVKKKGNKGYTSFYQYNGEVPKKWGKDGQMIVELLSTGNQTIVPPSIHPDTKEPYVWLTPDTLLDMEANELPKLPDNFIEQVDKIFGRDKVVKKINTEYSHNLPELSEVEKALSYIPSIEYSTWITIGMALKRAYGDNAFDAWDIWSRKAPSYEVKGMANKWSSFGNYAGTPVTIGTVFHMALSYGYIPESFLDFEINDNFIIQMGDEAEYDEETGEVIEEHAAELVEEFPEHLLDYIPGLPGEIAKWINSISNIKQPLLSLAASITACGTLYSHRITSGYSGELPNIYTMGLCPTGGGKDEARKAIKFLFMEADIYNLIIGDPASDVGLIGSLNEKDGVALLMMDEIGKKLQSLIKSKNSHEGKILDTTMELFSSSSSTFLGKEYADRSRRPLHIHNPHLSLYGTSTKDALYEALDSGASIDGFLNRWLIFETSDVRVRWKRNFNKKPPPSDLIDNIKNILNTYPIRTDPQIITSSPQLEIIPISDGAIKTLQAFGDECYDKMEKMGNIPTANLWARSAELAGKLALICHPYRERQIESVTAGWACDVVRYLTEKTVKAIESNVSDSEYQKNLLFIFNKIKNHKNGIKLRDLSSKTSKIPTKLRSEILYQLQEMEWVQRIERKNSNNVKSLLYKSIKKEK
jgi:hypothetical protein